MSKGPDKSATLGGGVAPGSPQPARAATPSALDPRWTSCRLVTAARAGVRWQAASVICSFRLRSSDHTPAQKKVEWTILGFTAESCAPARVRRRWSASTGDDGGDKQVVSTP